MGEVWKAQDTRFESRLVAIKLLREDETLREDARNRERFERAVQREASAAGITVKFLVNTLDDILMCGAAAALLERVGARLEYESTCSVEHALAIFDELVNEVTFNENARVRAKMRRLFRDEANSVANLRHDNIVAISDYGDHEGVPFLVMDYIEGRTLQSVIQRGEPLNRTRQLRLMEDLCSGLGHAHLKNLVHRDIKPANLIIDNSNDRLKVLDFGVVRRLQQSGESTVGVAIGTFCYMSPEQTRGSATLDHRSDIFSVGAVFYELLTGKKAFPPTGSITDLIARIQREQPRPVHELVPGIEEGIEPIIDKALEKRLDRRYQDLASMGRDIARVRVRLEREAELGDRTVVVQRSDETIISTRPTNVRTQNLLQRARGAYVTEDDHAVLEFCREALKLSPDNADVLDLQRRAAARLDVRTIEPLAREAGKLIAGGDVTSASALMRKMRELDRDSERLPALHEALESARRERRRVELEEAAREQERLAAAEAAQKAREQEAADARAREAAEAREREAAEARAREEAERLARAVAEARAEKERLEQEAREQAAREEVERAEKARLEQEAREQAKREQAERERLAREEAEARAAKERLEREARERAEQEAKARLEREAREEAEREAREQAEREAQERLAREEQERKEAEARLEAERERLEREAREAREAKEREVKEREEREARQREAREAEKQAREAKKREAREAKEREAREAKERAAREASEREEREARELAAREEQARLEREAQEQREREAREKEAREELERQQRAERERLEREAREQAERDRLEAEARAKEERERRAREEREAHERLVAAMAAAQQLFEQDDLAGAIRTLEDLPSPPLVVRQRIDAIRREEARRRKLAEEEAARKALEARVEALVDESRALASADLGTAFEKAVEARGLRPASDAVQALQQELLSALGAAHAAQPADPALLALLRRYDPVYRRQRQLTIAKWSAAAVLVLSVGTYVVLNPPRFTSGTDEAAIVETPAAPGNGTAAGTAEPSVQVQAPAAQPGPQPQTPAAAALQMTTVTIDLQPWARVRLIPDNAAVTVDTTPRLTPFSIDLAPGRYRLEGENGNLTQPLRDTITVVAGAPQVIRRRMPGFDADGIVNALLGQEQ